MENITDSVLQVPFLCGSVFLVVGGIMYFAPPSKINGLYGYRTSSSMKSQDRWDFSQKYSAKKMVTAAVVMLLFSLTGFLFSLSDVTKTAVGMGLMLSSCVYMIAATEMAIKKRFKDS